MAVARHPWAVDAEADERVGAVAARVLRSRLRALPPLLREAAASGGESVHRLRVATRRARAALDVFADLLGARKSDRFAGRLRAMRRAAGEVRDLDVLVDRLHRRPGRGPAADADALGSLEARRHGAGAPLRRLARKRSAASWHRDVERLVDTIGGRGAREPFDRFAARRLAGIGARFAAAADRVAAGARDDVSAAIHDLRIVAKKTRYATEILAIHAPARWRRSRLARLERFQDRAGICTDRLRAAERLRGLGQEARGTARRAFERLARREAAAAAKAIPPVLRLLPGLVRGACPPGRSAGGSVRRSGACRS